MEVNKTTQAEAVRNYYRKQGAEQEQLRIIKLLEEHKSRPKWVKGETISMNVWYCSCGYVVGNPPNENHFIALIKGENK